MKKIFLLGIFFITCCTSLYAQDPALTANDWILQDLVINGSSNLPSSITYITHDIELQFLDSGAGYSFQTTVCPNQEDIAGTLSYPNATFSSMTFQGAAQTLGMCCNPYVTSIVNPDQDCFALLSYSSLYAQFFMSDNPPVDFDYEFVTLANSTSLRITKGNGDYAIYNNAPLSTPDFSTALETSLTVNPVGEKLLLNGSNIQDINELSIYNLEGRKMMSASFYNDALDVSFLNKGVYFLTLKTLNSSKTLKFIR
jgi:hypothetical protein